MDHVEILVQKLTQWRVIIPLGIVVLVWLALPQQMFVRAPEKKVSAADTESLVSNFNAQKKMTCKIASARATIDDMKVRAQYPNGQTTEHVLFDGDCLYRWKGNGNNGERSCGLGSYLPFVKSIASNQAIERVFPQAQELAASCIAVDRIDPTTFVVPKNILFKNKKLF